MDSAVGVESDGSDLEVGEDRYPGPPYDEWDDSIKKSKEYREYNNFHRNIDVVPEEEGQIAESK